MLKITQDFELLGAGAAQFVKYEADGLRIALPAGKSQRPTGVVTTFGLSGDFDVSAGYEILHEPDWSGFGFILLAFLVMILVPISVAVGFSIATGLRGSVSAS